MRKVVGIDRKIKRAWLDTALDAEAIDTLVREGVRFQNAFYTTPSCSASRVRRRTSPNRPTPRDC